MYSKGCVNIPYLLLALIGLHLVDFLSMSAKVKLHEKISAYTQKLERYADRIWYPPLIGLLAALDNLVIIIPNDGILVASTLIIPRRWFAFALSVTIGSTLGAIALNVVADVQGLPWILEFFPGIDQTFAWTWTEGFFGKYGIWVVFAIGASPLMQQPVIILSALADTPVAKLATAIFAGRFIKFMVLSYLASHSPKYLKKLWGIKDELKDAGVKID